MEMQPLSIRLRAETAQVVIMEVGVGSWTLETTGTSVTYQP